MTAWELPSTLEIGGVDYAVRTDYRAVLDALRYLTDPAYEADERALICLQILFEDWERIPPEQYGMALRKAAEFIDAGISNERDGKCPSTMDWEQDAPLIIPAVNRVLGTEVRTAEHMHWWTFIGAYMEIRESLFSSVLNIRNKRAKKKPLEKHEQEFYRENRALVDLRRQQAEDNARKEALKKIFVR